MSGRVFLVGAGPGDPGLLTLRAAELLRAADVVVTDALVSAEIRAMIRPGAEVIYAGKRAGSHSMSQDEISALLVRLGSSGKFVVRLKGGDPFVFGRGGEEAEELRAAGIGFEVVPGITAGIAGAAYAGIPVTSRSLATAVTLVTGHESDETSGVAWDALARIGGTIVFYMGLSRLSDITGKLREAGMESSTPAAVISQATTPMQRTVMGTLGTLAGEVERTGIVAPALIVVGDVVRHAKELSWFETRPLFGRTIVVTRARAQASELASILADRGARIVQFPVIEIAPPESWESLDALVAGVADLDWIFFGSANGVEGFFSRLEEAGRDARSLARSKIAAVGTSTAAALRQRGLLVDLIPDRYQSSALLPLLPARMEGVRFGIVRPERGSEELVSALRERGADVRIGVAYRTVGSTEGRDELETLLSSGQIDAVTFTSGSTVEHFRSALGARCNELLRRVKLVTIGPVTTKAAEDAGLRVEATAGEAGVASLADAVTAVLTGR